MSKREVLVLLCAYVLSIVVRSPLLDRPLSAHHEYCTAFTLVALTNWYDDGFKAHHGVPSGGRVREGAATLPQGLDRNERAVSLYYFSHPPLAYDLPYVLFKITGTEPNVLGLQLINLYFQLVAVVALFFAVRWGWPNELQPAALFAAVLYCFLPSTLWFHGNAYMSDLFVQVPWLIHLAVAVRLFRRERTSVPRDLFLFGATLFLTVYTSWLGVFAGAAAVLFAFFRWYHDRSRAWLPVFMATAAAVLLALGLTAWRYLHVIDANALLAHMASRFEVRGSFHASDIGVHLRQLTTNYRTGFLPILLLITALVVWRKGRTTQLREGSAFLSLTGLPVLLDHLFLLQYADHDFAALKAAPFFCGVAGVILAQWVPRKAWLAVGVTCLLGVLYFFRQNPMPGMDNGRYTQEQDIGQLIAKHAVADEMVFAIGLSSEPQVTWYAKRNVIGVATVEDARALLRERDLTKGVVFIRSGDEIEVLHLE